MILVTHMDEPMHSLPMACVALGSLALMLALMGYAVWRRTKPYREERLLGKAVTSQRAADSPFHLFCPWGRRGISMQGWYWWVGGVVAGLLYVAVVVYALSHGYLAD